MENKSDSKPKPTNGELLKEIHNKVDAIYAYLFGCPERPGASLSIVVDRNTRFRKFATAILLTIVPTLVMILYLLFTNK